MRFLEKDIKIWRLIYKEINSYWIVVRLMIEYLFCNSPHYIYVFMQN